MLARKVLILANGPWPEAPRLEGLVARADRVLAADGGWAKALASGIPVDCVVGDLDSLSDDDRAALLASGIEVVSHPPDKDFTDLELAVERALDDGAERLVVFGAFGGRIDQSIANVLLLEGAVARGVDVEIVVGEETAWLIDAPFTLPIGDPGDRVSLVPLSEEAVVRTEGLRFPLDGEPLYRTRARGISNVIDRLPVRILLSAGRLLVVHAPAGKETPR